MGKECQLITGDCLTELARMEEGSADLILGSPPYELARTYLENGKNLGIARKTEEWVAWMVDVVKASLRVCKGLVAFVVAGQTKSFRWSAGPALLAADLHRAGIHLRNPPIFHRVGIPGSGGPDWLRGDYEWIICATNGGKLPWSDNTACGHAPKWAPGGEMSNRLSNGARVNQWGRVGSVSNSRGERPTSSRGTTRPSHKMTSNEEQKARLRRITSGHKNGDTPNEDSYDPPALANPGTVIEQLYTAEEVAKLIEQQADVRKHIVGGNVMASTGGGSRLASMNEAPFPEKLAEFFILSFCPPGGLVLDCFGGSGTVAAVAIRHGRRAISIDIRESQTEISRKRIAQETPMLFP